MVAPAYVAYAGFLKQSMEARDQVGILLGLPGCAQVFPYLSPGPLDFLVVCKNE